MLFQKKRESKRSKTDAEEMYPSMTAKETRSSHPRSDAEIMYPSMAAEKIRKIGQQYEPDDSMLVHIEPEEFDHLKKRGGSGEIDPVTGLPHLATTRDDDRDEEGGDDKPEKKDAPSRESRQPSDRWKEQTARELADFQAEMDARPDVTPVKRDEKGRVQGIGRMIDKDNSRGNDDAASVLFPNMPKKPVNPASDVPYGDAEEGMTALTESMPPAVEAAQKRARAKQKAAEDQTQWGISDGLGILASPVMGGAKAIGKLAMQKAAGQKAYNDAMHEEGFSELRPERGLLAERDGAKDTPVTAQPPKAPVADETETPATPTAPTFDDFVAKARRKKGYLSTILAGNVSAETPQGKKLYGS